MNKIALATVASVTLLLISLIALLDHPDLLRISVEDGPIETLGAASFLVASGFCLMAARRLRTRPVAGQRNTAGFYALAVLSVLFFFAFGEEVSWGQRSFDIETPRFFSENNLQDEMNLHNLKWIEAKRKGGVLTFLNMKKLFTYFWFSFCVVFPVVVARSSAVRAWVVESRFPVPPVSMGILFLLVHTNAVYQSSQTEYVQPIAEVSETMYAILFAAIAIHWFVTLGRPQAEPTS